MNNNMHLFTSGQVSKVYKNYLKNNFTADDFTWVLGSLCLLGKREEAQIFIKGKILKVEDYFFLALAAIRESDFNSAKNEIRKLIKLKNESPFFKYQIIAVYAYYQCRYKCCLTITKRSRMESMNLDNAFWKVLSVDLLGHTFVMMGEVHK